MMLLFRNFFSVRLRARRRNVAGGKRISLFVRAERTLIRVMVLCAILLTVFQLKLITDPVDFYMRIAGDIDSPAFKYDQYSSESPKASDQAKIIRLTFRTIPEKAPVVMWQKDSILADMLKDTTVQVEPGTVSLDASQIPYPVIVELILNDKIYVIDLHREKKSFDVQLKSPSAS